MARASATRMAVSVGEMRERLKAQNSRLNALVNNAAISPKLPGGKRMAGSLRPAQPKAMATVL